MNTSVNARRRASEAGQELLKQKYYPYEFSNAVGKKGERVYIPSFCKMFGINISKKINIFEWINVSDPISRSLYYQSLISFLHDKSLLTDKIKAALIAYDDQFTSQIFVKLPFGAYHGKILREIHAFKLIEWLSKQAYIKEKNKGGLWRGNPIIRIIEFALT